MCERGKEGINFPPRHTEWVSNRQMRYRIAFLFLTRKTFAHDFWALLPKTSRTYLEKNSRRRSSRVGFHFKHVMLCERMLASLADDKVDLGRHPDGLGVGGKDALHACRASDGLESPIARAEGVGGGILPTV